MKASVHQAAMVREHKWTPGGARMPLKLAMPPSTVRPTTRSRMERHYGPAVMTSVVKRGRDLLAPSPISEEDEGAWGNVAGPRRLSYSSEGTLTGLNVGNRNLADALTMVVTQPLLGHYVLCMDKLDPASSWHDHCVDRMLTFAHCKQC